MSVELENRLTELNEELNCANASIERLIQMQTPDVDFQIEMVTENINTITKEIASIVGAMS